MKVKPHPFLAIFCTAATISLALCACEGNHKNRPVSTETQGQRSTFLSVNAIHPKSSEIEQSLEGKFIVDHRPVTLKPPVDWKQDPYKDRSWRFWLHSLVFLEPLLQHYSSSGDVKSFKQAVALCLDWINANKHGTKGISKFAWYDMAVGSRAAYLGYIIREGSRNKLLSPEQRSTLVQSAITHGRWLADDKHYKAGHNHGLYEDAGLLILAQQCPELPGAKSWAEIASRRFLATTKKTVQWDEAMHLEHSPAYHFVITNLLSRFSSELHVGGDDLADLVQRMKQRGPWLVMPDGLYPQVGDTDLVAPPKWVLKETTPKTNFAFLPKSGAAIYKSDKSYLLFTCWYHSSGHKHSDELSFVWEEAGRRILIDTGRYGYYYKEPGRIFAESARAHNTLLVGEDFSWRGNEAYGSGLLDSEEQGDWYAILGYNPLFKKPLQHHRTLLYKPGYALIVVDEVEGAKPDDSITRLFHFAPKFQITTQEDNRFLAQDDKGKVWLLDSGQSTDAKIIRGQKDPVIQGYTFPGNRKWQENSVLKLTSSNSNQPLVFAMLLDDHKKGQAKLKTKVQGKVLTIYMTKGGHGTVIELDRTGDHINKLSIK